MLLKGNNTNETVHEKPLLFQECHQSHAPGVAEDETDSAGTALISCCYFHYYCNETAFFFLSIGEGVFPLFLYKLVRMKEKYFSLDCRSCSVCRSVPAGLCAGISKPPVSEHASTDLPHVLQGTCFPQEGCYSPDPCTTARPEMTALLAG